MTSEFEVLPEEANNASDDTGAAAEQGQPAYNGPSPGELLRVAREQRELTLEDIVTQSRMSMETVKALEEDREPPQNAWVYVRGYYRKYARVLGISEDEILQAHENHAGGIPEPQPVSAEWAPQDVSPSGGVSKVVLVLIAGILLGGAAWWLLQDGGASGEPELSQDQSGTTVTRSQTETAREIVLPERLDQQPATESAAPDLNETTEEAAEPELTSEATAIETTESETESAVDAVEAENVHETVAASAGNKLGLEFIDRSWVNVVDATGKKLLDGIVKANAQLAVEGQPPFRVFLGYAPGVKVSYAGNMIDTQPYTASNNTARFTVGDAQAETPE